MNHYITILIILLSFLPSQAFAESEIIKFSDYRKVDYENRYQNARGLRAHLLELMPVGTAMEKVEEIIKKNGGNEYFSDYSIYSKKGWGKTAPRSEWPSRRKLIDDNDGEIVSITDIGLTSYNSVMTQTYQVKYRHKHSRKYMAKNWTILVQFLDGKVLDIHTKFNSPVK